MASGLKSCLASFFALSLVARFVLLQIVGVLLLFSSLPQVLAGGVAGLSQWLCPFGFGLSLY